jgi:hypothetical protein
MRATNFTWHDPIHVRMNGEDYDLHNNFNFRQFTYDPHRQLLILQWELRNGDGTPEDQPKNITLRLKGVTHFSFRERNLEMPFSEDDCLASFGYDFDRDWAGGQFWTDNTPEDDWRWSFIFQSGAEIQVAGEVAMIEISSK